MKLKPKYAKTFQPKSFKRGLNKPSAPSNGNCITKLSGPQIVYFRNLQELQIEEPSQNRNSITSYKGVVKNKF